MALCTLPPVDVSFSHFIFKRPFSIAEVRVVFHHASSPGMLSELNTHWLSRRLHAIQLPAFAPPYNLPASSAGHASLT